ncbi:MAG: ribonuclease HII [Chthoniobacterales bacterium]|nr:ribonuclease HII [Chthoniobacterales bacterium]
MPCNLEAEDLLRSRGFKAIAGVDEAGRGPLAGPVFAAAVILPVGFELSGLDDSKKLAPKMRERLAERICSYEGVIYCVASASVVEIDEMNILRATYLAMRRALDGLVVAPDFALVDGLPVEGLEVPHEAIVGGDSRSLSIAAASVLAKVARDREMRKLAEMYPEYAFEKHKGYGTALHLTLLRKYGPSPIHRKSFKPVAEVTCAGQ